MEYNQISSNSTFNKTVQDCFLYISEEDKQKFLKKFRDQSHDQVQVTHTLRELIVGAYLASQNLNVRHDYPLATKTPDWSVFDQQQTRIAIVELTNFHTESRTEDQVNIEIAANRKLAYWMPPNNERLYESIRNKASVYKTFVEKEEIAYVIAVFGEKEAAVDWAELRDCLFGEGYGLFQQYPTVSGVLFFQQGLGYVFTYVPNPNPLKSILLGSDFFLSDLASPPA